MYIIVKCLKIGRKFFSGCSIVLGLLIVSTGCYAAAQTSPVSIPSAIPSANKSPANATQALTSTNVKVLSGNQIQIQLNFSKPLASAPVRFATQQPPRVILDFKGVTNKLDNSQQNIALAMVQALTAVQAEGRTRVIIDLTAVTAYQTQISGNAFLITFAGSKVEAPKNTPVTATPKKRAATSSSLSPLLNPHQITAIDFRRGESNTGRIVINLTDSNTSVDVDEQGQQLVVNFLDTRIAQQLQRRLDVTDFGTPVQLITTKTKGNHVQMTVDINGSYNNMAYQAGKQFIIEVTSMTMAQQLEQQKKEPHYTGKRITLNFQDISVRAALQLISDFTGINIVVSDTVQGTMTLHLEDVPWDQALATILTMQGLGKRQFGNVIMVAPATEISEREKKELQNDLQVQALVPLYSELIQVNYAKAADMATLLKSKDNSLLGARGSVSVDNRTNSLWVQDTPDKLKEIKDFIKKLDVPVRQVLIEARIVNIDKSYEEDIGVRWGVSNTSDLSGTFRGASQIANGTAPSAVTPITDRLNVNLPASPTDSSLQPASFAIALAKIGQNAFLDLELSALEVEGHAKIVSSPRLVTSNQQPALIQQGSEIPYQEATSSGATAVAFKEAVLALRVTPQITPDNRLILKIQVNQDKPSGQTFGGVPSIDTREIRTQVLVDNGQTIVLGGIYEQTDQTKVVRVPFLGTLPVIGYFFRSKQVVSDRTELLIFITPKIVEQSYVA